jgi:glutaminyl-peptide cyclotransferase
MMRELFILFTACLLAGCDLIPQPLSGKRALKEVERLVKISPRDAGTTGANQAAQHIASRLTTFGYRPAVNTFLSACPSGESLFFNVIAERKGLRDEWIVIGSHFDTKSGLGPEFQGANDSGSSTGLLLELARHLRFHRPDLSIMFAFFDGEECMVHYSTNDGLHGSRQLARRLKKSGRKIHGVIILDMVGDKDLTLTIPSNVDYELLGHAFDAAQEMGQRDRLMMYSEMLDDHCPFIEAGYPAIDLIDFFYGASPGLNNFWHTPEDSLDKLSPESLQFTGDLVLNMINRISQAHVATDRATADIGDR